MADEWKDTTVGELLSLEYGRALPERSRDGFGGPVLGSNGIVGYHSKTSVDGPGIVVGRKGTAGSVTWVDSDFTPIDTTYWVKLRTCEVSLEFTYLLLSAIDLPSVCAQTGVPGLNRDRAYDISVTVPPLRGQRRIVDLMAHLDTHLANLREEREATERLLSASLSALDSAVSGMPTVALGKVGTFRSGPSWSAKEETSHVVAGSDRVLKITNTKPDGSIDMSDETYVVGLPQASHRLGGRSLVIIRTNGNRQRIGNVYRPTGAALGCAVSAFQFSGEFRSTIDRDWTYWWLRAPARQKAMSDAASGSTGLGNLAVSWLNSLELSWPEEADRRQLIAPLEQLAHLTDSFSAEIAAQEDVRQSLLGSLLNGTVTLPGSYDSFISEVA